MTRFNALPYLIACVLFLSVVTAVTRHHRHHNAVALASHQGPFAAVGVVASAGTVPTPLKPVRSTRARRNHPSHRIPALWRQLAFCESSGRWHLVNPPYAGGLEFMASTWTSFDTWHYAPTADQATPWQQVRVARHVLRVQGWAAWPVCSVKLGLR